MQVNLVIALSVPDPETKKREIKETAEAYGMSISKFMLYCYDQLTKDDMKKAV